MHEGWNVCAKGKRITLSQLFGIYFAHEKKKKKKNSLAAFLTIYYKPFADVMHKPKLNPFQT